MSEEAKPRPLAEINNEYTALCAQAGQKQYQIECAQADLKALNAALRDVNTEAAKSKQFYDSQAVETLKAVETAPAEASADAGA